MNRDLSEDDIRIIDNRGRYSIRKGVVWGTVAVCLLVMIFLGARLTRQARFISELTSGQAIATCKTDVRTFDRICIVEVNGAKVNLTMGKINLKLLNWAIELLPDKYSKDPHKDLAIAYRIFKRRIGIQHLKEFDYDVIHIKVDYHDGLAYKYSFSNSLNNYSMTVLCSYDNLVRILDPIVSCQ